MTMTTRPPARERRRKTRTKKINPLPPIKTSDRPAHLLDLTPGMEHMVCPECEAWCPLTGVRGTPKLVPHHTEPAGTATGRRCTRGSDRAVVLDVAAGEWRRVLAEAAPTVASRRATKVLPKPRAMKAPAAITQLAPAQVTAETVRQRLRAHLVACAACSGDATSREGHRLRCPDGDRLAAAFLTALEAEPGRRVHREACARERLRFDRQYAARAPRERTSQWAAVEEAVRSTDSRRAQLPDGDIPAGAPPVPLHPLRPTR